MKTAPSDSRLEVEEELVDRLRVMGAAGRAACLGELQNALEALALAGIRHRRGGATDARQERLRLFSLRLGRDVMIRAFGWDPATEGY